MTNINIRTTHKGCAADAVHLGPTSLKVYFFFNQKCVQKRFASGPHIFSALIYSKWIDGKNMFIQNEANSFEKSEHRK